MRYRVLVTAEYDVEAEDELDAIEEAEERLGEESVGAISYTDFLTFKAIKVR